MMERSFKQQGLVVDIVRDNWYQETLKRRKELGMDQEQTVKQEVVGEENHKVEAEVIPIENIDTKRTVASRSESEINKMDNKEAIRAEIKEIEKKLLKKKRKKEGKRIGTEAEDGECSDSEENFDEIEVEKRCVASAPISDEISKKKIENRKRWGKFSKGFEEGTGRTSEERVSEKKDRTCSHYNSGGGGHTRYNYY